MTFVWFEIVGIVGIVGIWTMLLTGGRVPEIAEGESDIWFDLLSHRLRLPPFAAQRMDRTPGRSQMRANPRMG